MNSPVKQKIRCAVYTRKSHEEGLEQEFNSLDAQREAAEAYITAQRHEGWMLYPDRFDDGGFTGGNIERPALKRLMADIEAGKIDVVVVYKIDRLTRSLADFSKLIEIFEKYHVSFVSVTQQFNTTTSMGRLVLNVLLSFAQFEREVTGERIRDKLAASKRKGMWMGGVPPMGYNVDNRKLVIDPPQAEIIRFIFARFLATRSVTRRGAGEGQFTGQPHRQGRTGRDGGHRRSGRGGSRPADPRPRPRRADGAGSVSGRGQMAALGRDADRHRRDGLGADRRPPQGAALMWMVVKAWLLRLIGWGVAALSVAAVLFGARQAGRNAERVDQLKKSLEVKDAQLRATLDAPRNRGELVDRLRDGKF